jgi:hypothetical protein
MGITGMSGYYGCYRKEWVLWVLWEQYIWTSFFAVFFKTFESGFGFKFLIILQRKRCHCNQSTKLQEKGARKTPNNQEKLQIVLAPSTMDNQLLRQYDYSYKKTPQKPQKKLIKTSKNNQSSIFSRLAW